MSNGPFSGAVRVRPFAAGLFDPLPGAAQILTELLTAHLVGPPVQIAVDRDLMPAPRRFPHEIRVPSGDPAEKEECRPVPAPLHPVEQSEESLLDPRQEALPAPRIGVVIIPADMEPVLHVNRQDPRRPAGEPERSDSRL